MPTDPLAPNKPDQRTDIHGDVNTGSGDFVARDKNIHLGPFTMPMPLALALLVLIILGVAAIGLIAVNTMPRSNSASKILWEQNWLTVNESHGFLGSSAPPEEGGGSWTNREEFLEMLNALDVSSEPGIEGKRLELIALIHQAEANPTGDSYYNVRYTPEIRALEDDIKRAIRNKAVEHGVDVQRAAP
jgi:hypothetical protein